MGFFDGGAKGVAAQLIGFCGTGLMLVSYQCAKRKNILVFQIFSGCCWVVHYFLLGAFTGCMLNALGAVRSFIYSRESEWAKKPVWLVVFLAAFTAAGLFTWDGLPSLLPTAAMLLTTVSLRFKSEKAIRFVTFPSSPLWMIYNIIRSSLAGTVTEICVTASLTAAIIRYDVIPGIKQSKDT